MIYLKSKEFFKSSQNLVTTELRSPQEPYPEHSHSFEEIVIVNEGFGTHVLNDVPMNLSKNYVCFVKREDRHLFDQVDDLYLSNILFEKDKMPLSSELKKFMPLDSDKNNGWFINEESAEKVNQLISCLDIESHSDSLQSRITAQAIFQLIIVELWRGRINDVSLLSNNDKVFMALSQIQQQYAQINELEPVADMVKLSSRQLTKYIKKMTGMNFNQYLHYTRASKALESIIYTEKSITDIAFEVGYKDSNYFSTKFKRFTKKTPSQYR